MFLTVISFAVIYEGEKFPNTSKNPWLTASWIQGVKALYLTSEKRRKNKQRSRPASLAQKYVIVWKTW